ncbi:hypothetical protein K6T82_11770 [Flavobacterium sp. 17A]|uniref:Lipoprotein n=1 Tax=Flavobacterium potami TaxID=2872310 RepID=A0A9X1H9Z5_9FLAO|nr:hypothetical protein [Flavobacterium potami]MBZ4035448.1 hypothetical protein [Flavobacterium potami]
MKRIIILFLIGLSVYGCSSTKDLLPSPVDTYLGSRLAVKDTVIIISNKINSNYVLDLFKERSLVSINNNTLDNSIISNDPSYVEEYWNLMNKRYRNYKTDETWVQTSFWTQDDFKNPQIKFMKEKDFPKPTAYNEFMSEKSSEVTVFAFSDPVFYQNKQYALFAKSETTTKKQFIKPISIVIMKAEKGKWIYVKEINDGNYY